MKSTPRTNMKTPTTPTAVTAEMRRLAKIHPLLSPTSGWSKLKGLHSIGTLLQLSLTTPVHPALDSTRVNPLWARDLSPAVRKEAESAFRGLLTTVTKLASAALKPAGWKLKTMDHQNSHALAMVWTRKGREVALLCYAEQSLPGISWRNTGLKRNWSPTVPNNYWSDVQLFIATPKRSPEVMGEVCAALSRVVSMRREMANFEIPREFGQAALHGMPQVHICKSAQGDGLAPQHRKLVESLRGKVCFVGFSRELQLGGGATSTPANVIIANPHPHSKSAADAQQSWTAMSAALPAGSIRLVAVDDQGRMKWCETFGSHETVPQATVKRLLASSHYTSNAPWIEQEAIYRSVRA